MSGSSESEFASRAHSAISGPRRRRSGAGPEREGTRASEVVKPLVEAASESVGGHIARAAGAEPPDDDVLLHEHVSRRIRLRMQFAFVVASSREDAPLGVNAQD